MPVREARREDLTGLLRLYTHLHGNSMPAPEQLPWEQWEAICTDPRHHMIVAEEAGAGQSFRLAWWSWF